MFLKSKLVVPMGLLCLALPASMRASQAYTYTPTGAPTISVTFTTTLSGAGLDNATISTADLVGNTFSITATPPGSDNAGFPVVDNSVSPGSFTATTDALGNIVSWNIQGLLFASYPAFPGEDPNDFFCNYNVTTSNGGDSSSLTHDNDAGFCPASAGSSSAGTWSPTFSGSTSTPEPGSALLLLSGLIGFGAMTARNRRSNS
jgi:hypothetical protein